MAGHVKETFALFEVLPLELRRKEPELNPGTSDVLNVVSKFIEGNYEECLQLPCMRQIWKTMYPNSAESRNNLLIDCDNEILKNHNSYEIQTLLLLQGAAALQLFVQNNWTGPPSEKTSFEVLSSLLGHGLLCLGVANESQFRKYAWECLRSIGDSIYVHVMFPEYLWLARLLLIFGSEHLQSCQTAPWWELRCINICQHLLQEPSAFLHDSALKCINNFVEDKPLMSDEKYWYLQVQFHLEVAYVASIYYEHSLVKEHLDYAQKLTGIQINLTGALGKRTQYQAEDKAQLLLQIKSDRDACPQHYQNVDLELSSQIPKDIKLDDDVRLESIKYQNEDEVENKELTPVEQAVLLGIFSHLQNTSAVHKLVEEELTTYLTRLLEHPKVWSIQSMALIHRSKLESKYRRTVERSLKQLQELVDGFEKGLPTAAERMWMFYCTNLPPRWQIEQRLANLLCSVGAIKSALEIYLRLQLWEDIIKCYILLERKHEAEEVIRQQLAIDETPLLWCYLGDVTKNPECYIKAWELSDSRSSRAQKGLGEFYFSKQQYAEAIPFYQKSLELNSFQLDCWSHLAFAAMKTENWELTAQAYRRFIDYEPDNFEAWNNLSQAYIKLKKKKRAWKALQEALRCNFEDWRIWENFLLVSVDVDEFEEAIKAYHRILDLKEKHVDEEVLSIIVQHIICLQDIHNGCVDEILRSSALQLFGRLTSQVTTNGRVWYLYAKLARKNDDNSTTLEKVLQYLQRACATSLNKPGWEKDLPRCQETLLLAQQIIEVYLLCANSALYNQDFVMVLKVAQTVTKGVVTRLKNYKNSTVTGTLPEDMESALNTLEEKLQKITAKLSADE